MEQLQLRRYGVTILVVALASILQQADAAPNGTWTVIVKNSGISAMHAAVTPNVGSVVLLHHTDSGPSNLTFPGGRCRVTKYDKILKKDCFAHSVILNPVDGAVRPLMVMTDTQCSSGQFVADGTLYQTGGALQGNQITRTLSPSCYTVEPTSQICDWVENKQKLKVGRWYATNQLLPDGRQIVVGGINNPSVEFAPPTATSQAIPLGLLSQSGVLYPFVFLLQSGNLFIFVNRSSIIYNYQTNTVVQTLPDIPGHARTYPSGGSAVMLPLKWDDDYQSAEVLVCGGATSTRNVRAKCSTTCGRIWVTNSSAWAMETMPGPRCMGDMVLLPDTNALIINGAAKGFQGWMKAMDATLNPVLYSPAQIPGSRFTTLAQTSTARVYHSTANLMTDGRVLVAGSNTHQYYSFSTSADPTNFPTDVSVEAFLPPYAESTPGGRATFITGNQTAQYGGSITVQFWDIPTNGSLVPDTWLFTMNSPAWSTHSFSHGQRLVILQSQGMQTALGLVNGTTVNINTATIIMPKYNTVLPAAYYMLWAVKNGNPSTSCFWVKISA